MASDLRVLFLGTYQSATSAVRKHFSNLQETVCETKEEYDRLIESAAIPDLHFIAVGPRFEGISLTDLGQSLRMTFQGIPVFFVTNENASFDRTELMRNGFDDAFLMPLDQEQFGKVIAGFAAHAAQAVFTAVRLVDIEPGSKLDFQLSVYLPANNKYIVYSAQGDVLEQERLARLSKHKHNSVYVPMSQIKSFYVYSANRLKELAANGKTGTVQTLRDEKLRHSVRELITGMLSESYSRHLNQGKKVVDHTRAIVREYIMINNPGEWAVKLFNEIGQKGDMYTHAGSVSTYAVLFSILADIGAPDELAIAGLLHDIGMSALPADLQTKNPAQMTPQEFEIYSRHPLMSVEMIQARKLTVPDSVLKAVAQHHEKWNGQGFPMKSSYKGVAKVSQILAIADRFDYLTRVESSVSPLSPDQAIRQIEREVIADPDLIKSLRLIFEQVKKAAS